MKRRSFFKKSGLSIFAALGLHKYLSALPNPNWQNTSSIESKKVILLQGDSITDGNRGRNNDWNHVMGHGYAYLIASRLWHDYPQEGLMFYNRGISGDRVRDLQARWQTDCLDLNPHVLSILVGVNDVIALVEGWDPEPAELFKERYTQLLERTKENLPETQLILCEPFILPLGWVEKKPEIWKEEILKHQEIVRELSQTFDTLFVPFQEAFTEAAKIKSPDYWIWDGVHPMPAGHELMARKWIKVAQEKLDFLTS